MHSKLALVTAAAALASFLPTALAGKASIENNCNYPAYIWSTSEKADDMITLKPGESYSEEYRSRKDNAGGISIKMSDEESKKDVSQFEYTISGEKVFYDLSNIDGYPFKDGGISIQPSDDSCPVVTCAGGEAKCEQAYNKPDDDHATKGCPIDSDLHMILCIGGGGKEKKMKEPTYVRPVDRRHARAFQA